MQACDLEKTWYISIIAKFLTGDCVRVIGTPVAFARDVKTLRSRLAAEGESFLTKTLPALGRQIDTALSGTHPLHVTAFKKRRSGSAIPAFLQGLLCRVFDDDGKLKSAPCIQSIRLVRQLCYWVYKMERKYSEKSLRKAHQKFITTDASLPTGNNLTRSRDLVFAKALISSCLRKLRLDNLRPSHGPGAVAGRENTVTKRRLSRRFRKLERYFRPIPFWYSLRDVAQDISLILDNPPSEKRVFPGWSLC